MVLVLMYVVMFGFWIFSIVGLILILYDDEWVFVRVLMFMVVVFWVIGGGV